MSNFHGQTRPDAPRIPQDLATKLYVDDQNLAINFWDQLLALSVNIQSQNGNFWNVGDDQASGTRVARQTPIGQDCISRIMKMRIDANSQATDLTFTLEINAVASLQVCTVLAGVTGVFSSTVEVTISEDDLIGIIQANADAVNICRFRGFMQGFRTT